MTYAAEWMRIAFMQFLSSEGKALMGIKDSGNGSFMRSSGSKAFLDLVIKNADKTNSAIPDRAKERNKTAWNVQE